MPFEYFDGLFEELAQEDPRSVKFFVISEPGIWGVGNGYLQDILFRAGIHPKRRAVDIAGDERKALYRAIRTTLSEAVELGGRDTERDLFNACGTFYELPARNAGGFAKVRPVATHNRLVHDFCSYRGLFLISGVAADAPAGNPHILRSDGGKTARWAGAIDDVWQLGKPRGSGGPWRDAEVRANQPSDPYLMTAYDRKSYSLAADRPVTLTVEDTGGLIDINRTTVSIENLPPEITDVQGPAKVEVGKKATFTVEAVDADGEVNEHGWDFDATDGITFEMTGTEVTTKFGRAGTFNVTCIVRDDDGGQTVVHLVVKVKEAEDGSIPAGTMASALLVLLYSLGHCGFIVLAGTLGPRLQTFLNWDQKSKTTLHIRRACGVLLLAVGLYLIWNA